MSTGQPGDIFGGSLRFFLGGVHVDVWRLKLYNNQCLNGHFNWMIPNHYMKNLVFHQTSISNWLFGVPGDQ